MSDMRPTVGFVGLGRMGLPMAANLLKAGFSVVGCDRDPARAAALAAQGAEIAPRPPKPRAVPTSPYRSS